ncbi:hypothetical protein GIB67_031497 [Kingdonia uniflora]|uniref:Cytochrome P450 n=1 Tax=Kingdonia uniflora TaxID=39325 RepID=A0A7J7MNB9_9MAGN|nr:hypothetical protein GIB67_031497 [Kingdonia uniflora]
MEFYQLLLTLLFSISLWFLFRNKGKTSCKLPPGKTRSTWTIICENLEFYFLGRMGIPEKFIEDRMRKHSSQVFKTTLLGENVAVFCGAPGNKFLFSNENKLLQVWWPSTSSQIFPIESCLQEAYQEEGKKLNTFASAILKPETIQTYLHVMDSMIKQHLDMYWDTNEKVTVLPLAKILTFSLGCNLFLSIEEPLYIAKLAEKIKLIAAGIISAPVNILGSPLNRAIKASKFIRKELQALIKQRKIDIAEKKVSTTQDLLSHMLIATEVYGSMNEADIASKIMSILVAGFDAPSTTITFIMKYLAELPDVYGKVLQEQMEIGKSKGSGESLTWKDIQKMRYSWNVLFWNAFSTHKNPNYFPDPEKFNPSRFEGDRHVPYAFIPFGGGTRMCPGMQYARAEILVFMYNVVRRFKWTKLYPDEKIRFDPIPRPVRGLPIQLIARKNDSK